MNASSYGRSKHPDRVGPYRLEGRLGKGGMGAVYRAWDERLKRPVAIKHILPEADDPASRERFRREAQAAARLNHSAIVHIYDVVENEDGDWIVMELVEGRRLDRILRDGPLSLRRALRLTREVGRGLAEAHSKGIVHRDLKAENVMVTASGHAKILDFGLAKFAPDVRDPSLSTTQGAVMGTARAMSPEQAMGLGVDHRSDLFSMGTLFYEVLTGRSPFKAEAVVETLRRVCRMRQQPARELNPKVPVELSDLVDLLLAKDPEERPGNARLVVADLVRISKSFERLTPTEELLSIPSGDDESDAEARRGDSMASGMAHEPATIPHRPLAGILSKEEEKLSPPPETVAESAQRDTEILDPAVLDTVADRAAPRSLSRQLGERRQVTVLCCGLLGSVLSPLNPPAGTSAASDPAFTVLDPELLSEVLPEFQHLAKEIIGRFEGLLGNAQGHRLWAYFGYPQAHENDAELAVRAALELVEAVFALELENEQLGLALRVGVHTGAAVVLDPSATDQLALGPTLDLVEGIHALAEPASVIVSAETWRLVERSFTSETMEDVQLPGFEEMLSVFRIRGTTDPQEQMDLAASQTPLVGRLEERELLQECWKTASAGQCLPPLLPPRGQGQTVFLSGDAGIGKSRLLRSLQERLVADRPSWWIAQASTFASSSPLEPMIDLLRRTFELDVRKKTEPLERLEETLRTYGLGTPELVALFAALLGVPWDHRHPAPSSTAERRRTRTLEAVADLFLEMAKREPGVLVFEDLQWADPSTLELLERLLDRVASAPLLLVITYRPDFELPWRGRENTRRLRLNPLSTDEVELLIRLTAGDRELPAEIRQQIVERTDGVPLFVEELTRNVLESDLMTEKGGRLELTEPHGAGLIPATLRDSLMERLDRLGPAKELAQLASVIGRQFSFELLAAVSPLDDTGLRRELERLVRAGLVYRGGLRSRGFFLFKHALIQEAAYMSLLRKERRTLHLEIAQALAHRFTDTPPELLAYHFTQARRRVTAVGYWLQAGQRALERSANLEAIAHLRRGIEMVDALQPGRARDQFELSLRCALIPALIAVVGYGDPEVEEIMTWTFELSREIPETPQLFWALWSLWAHELLRGDFPRARELAAQLLRLARDNRDRRLHAHYAIGFTLYYTGHYEDARGHLESGMALDGPDRDRGAVYRTGQDVGVTSRSALALTLWHLGHPDRALELSQEALARARETAHPNTLAFAMQSRAWILLYRGNTEQLRRQAEELTAFCHEQRLWLGAVGHFQLQCALALDPPDPCGDEWPREMSERLSATLANLVTSGVGPSRTVGFCHAAELHLRLGRHEEARALLEEGFQQAEAHPDEGHWLPELHRLRGELLLAGVIPAKKADLGHEAERCFETALAIAREQGDRALERRAAKSLAGMKGGKAGG